MSERELPKALGIAVAAPEAQRGGNTLGAIPWEDIVHSKKHKDKEALEFVFDSKSKASGRGAGIKRRFRDVDPLAIIVTRVRVVPEDVIKQLKLAPDTEWFGVWVEYKGEMTQAERDESDRKIAERAAARQAAGESSDEEDLDDDAAAVAEAASV